MSDVRRPAPKENRLLNAVPGDVQTRLFPALEPFSMPLGEVLYESGDTMQYVYFPTDSIVSLLYVMEDGASAEISVVGNEGIVGVAVFMGGNSTPSRALVQSGGNSYRMRAQTLKNEFNHPDGELRMLMLRYTQAQRADAVRLVSAHRDHCP